MWPFTKGTLQCRCHMWVEFDVGFLLCSERLFWLRILQFSTLDQNPTFPNFNSTRNRDEELLSGSATFKSLFIYSFLYLSKKRSNYQTGANNPEGASQFHGVSNSFGAKSQKTSHQNLCTFLKMALLIYFFDLKGIKILFFSAAILTPSSE